ncbi:aminoglycoside phosphotransferase family protein [Microbacterium sp. zg.B48]|uniref:aminoglycoside phosphotransferase family protein n=1 Tax=Microbacterium sp. zg.B48 TaxID=2969408 RepID=UPI00214C11FE|nr:aminoglycoside phosphotransferase family protein [Microbacterium sp. zg.B48]MCR2764250.1 aminoglycoside phosphotransferase family protein [Microbacterium sp. zg.B48]
MASEPSAVDAARIDEKLVRMLVREQFPQWAQLSLTFVERGGNDHRMFRLGGDLVVRLPSAPGYVAQVQKEQQWLPRLAPAVPLPIPLVHGSGRPSRDFPAPWSIYSWLAGEPAARVSIDDPVGLAAALAEFLVALRHADTTGAPRPGQHSAFRGGPLQHWDDEMGDLFARLQGAQRADAQALWRDALDARSTGEPGWVHGDVSLNNLLMRDGHLGAVIDFGCAAVGDPACDTVILWTFFTGEARAVFRRELAVDDATWTRGQGWALWKALIMLTNIPAQQRALADHVLDQLLRSR